MSTLVVNLFPPGLFTLPFMVHAWVAATAIAVVAGVVGFFVNLRGATFAAHAVPRAAFTGAAAAFVVGVSSLMGMAAFTLAVSLSLATLERRGESSVLTALILVAALGLGDLLLTVGNAYGPAAYALLFGQLVGISGGDVLQILGLALVVLGLVGVLYRPLLFYTVSPETAEARGVPSRTVRLGFMALVAGAAALTVPVVGALLAFALLVAPAAAAHQLASRPGRMMAASVAIAVLVVWISILVAYDTDLPVGFVVTAVGTLAYAAARAVRRGRRTARPGEPPRLPESGPRALDPAGAS
jgi:zinc/manganese transport system permease protein